MHQAASAPVVQERDPTLRNRSELSQRPPASSSGRYFRESTEESRLSSSRNSVAPPSPTGAVRAVSCDFCQRATRPRHEKLLVRICVLIPTPGVPKANATSPKCRGLMFQDGDIAGPPPSRASDRLASSTFALYFEYSTQTKWCCSGNRHPIFRSYLLFGWLWTTYHILAQEQCMTTENNTPEYIFYRPLYSGAHGVSA